MGRDKVLGLSLAILVIGFAGAFCYRNEEFVEHGLKLARAKILDEGIAQRPGPKPYVTESKSDSTPPAKPMVTLGAIEAVEPVEPPRSGQRSRRGTLTVVPRGAPQPIDTSSPQSPPIEQFVSAQKERSAPEAASTTTDPGPTDRSAAIVDKPLELTIRPNSPAFAPPDSLLDDSMTWQHSPNGRDGCPAMTGRESERSDSSSLTGSTESSRPVTYSVRRGDTLSKIALHFLGDSNRYREIFEVNRDQLQNPNARLKVGMTLRIPGDRPRTKRPASSAVSQSKSTRANSSSPGTPRTRQVPARPVSRSRELPNRQPGEDSSPAKSSVEEPTEPIGTPRFVPVSKGPFWRNRGDSSSADPRSRDLSQRAPAIRSKSSASDKDVERKLDANPSDDASTTSSPKKDVDNSSMSSEGSEGM